MTKSTIMHTIKEIFVIDLAEFCAANNFEMRIDIPSDDSIIREIEANTSNLTNEELR